LHEFASKSETTINVVPNNTSMMFMFFA
jgi:hypothetical protein